MSDYPQSVESAPEPVFEYGTSQPFLERIEAAVKSTREAESNYIEYREDGAYRDGTAWWKRDSADGIGTKGLLHWQHRTFAEAAQDAFAMAVNDLYRDRCVPYKLTNVLLAETDDEEAIAQTIEGLATLAKERGIQMGDGETAILNVLQGFELDVTATGREVRKVPNQYQAGDTLLAIPSSGIHSNGLTLARELFEGEVPAEILTPTRIYDEITKLHYDPDVHGLTHVTGDAFRKLRLNGPDLTFVIDELPVTPASEVFDELYRRLAGRNGSGADAKMYTSFNNGIGFVIGVRSRVADQMLRLLPDAVAIGSVEHTGDPGVNVRSRYTDRIVSL